MSIEDIVDSLRSVWDDIAQIVKLTSEEKVLVSDFLSVLKQVPKRMFSVPVSTSGLPARIRAFTQARIDSTGHLILTTEDGRIVVMDLSEIQNRDIMMAVVNDIIPKFKDLVTQLEQEKLRKPKKVKEKAAPKPPKPVPGIVKEEELLVELPVRLTELDVEFMLEEVQVGLVDFDSVIIQEEVPEPEPEPVPVKPVLEKPKLEDVVAETLEYLDMLGDEVFDDKSPVSVCFDDWLVNLRQVMVAFESNEAVTLDEIFTDECEQIYNDIEEELGNRLLEEAELEASSKTLEEKKYILREMDDEYAAKSNNMQVKGKSALDFMIKNVQRLEDEIAKTQQIKTNNIIKRIALKQKRYTLGQKLKSAKYRLSSAMEKAATKGNKPENIDPTSATNIEINENSSKVDLTGTVKKLEEELSELKNVKTSFLQPQKKIAQDQKISEITQKLDEAKHLLKLAAQESEVEKQKIREEYEKKKQDTIKNVQTLEKDIATKRTDTSITVRKEATKALANAVNLLIERSSESNSK